MRRIESRNGRRGPWWWTARDGKGQESPKRFEPFSTMRPALRLGAAIIVSFVLAWPILAAMADPWVTSFSPGSGTFTNTTVNVTVEWCSDQDLGNATHSATVHRPDESTDNVSGSFTFTEPWTIIDCDHGAKASGSITLETAGSDGDNVFRSQVCDPQTGCEFEERTYTLNVDDVSVKPDGGTDFRTENTTGHSVDFDVINLGTTSDTYSFSESCDSPATNCDVSPSSSSIAAGDTITVTVDYDVGSPGTGKVELTATHNSTSATDDGYRNISVQAAAPDVDVEVTPDPGSSTRSSHTTGHSEVFTVTNTGGQTDTYNFSHSCDAPVTSCSPSLSSAVLGQGADTTVTVSYDVTSPGLGTITLTATNDTAPSATDNGSFDIEVGGEPAGGEPWVTEITPPSDTLFSDTVNVAVTWCDQASLDIVGDTTHSEFITRPGQPLDVVTDDFTWNTNGGSVVCEHHDGKSQGTIILEPGRNAFNAWVNDEQGKIGKDSAVYFLRVDDVEVTPDGKTVNQPANTQSHVETFTVANAGNATATYVITEDCTAPVTNCSVDPDTVTVDSAQSVDVDVTYDVGSTGTGKIVVTATHDSISAISDSGYVDVGVGGSIVLENPEANLDRSRCLTVNMGGGILSQCGDLVMAHPLPATRTQNRLHAPTLIYNNRFGLPLVTFATHVAVGGTPPDTVMAVVKEGGTAQGTKKWPGSLWTPGSTRRIVVQDSVFPAWSQPSTLGEYVVEVSFITGGTPQVVQTDSIQVGVVNWHRSPFGRGWWLAGFEKLHQVDSDRYLWVGGDGSTRLYENSGNGVDFVARPLTHPDTLRRDTLTNGFIRELKGGVTVEFDSDGDHIKTTNRLGQTTDFLYNGSYQGQDKLWKIRLPVPPGAPNREYVFSYGQGSDRSVVKVTAPPVGSTPREVEFDYAGGSYRIVKITDADGEETNFHHVIATGVDTVYRRDGTPISVTYDNAGRIATSRIHMTGTNATDASDIVTTFRSAEMAGWAPNAATHPNQTYALVDGPRSVADTTMFFLDHELGAPWKIVDALGGETLIERGTGTYRALVTRLERANGHIMSAAYNERGNVVAVTDSSRAGNPTTRYRYQESLWPDGVTTLIPPTESDSIEFTYDSHGNMQSRLEANTALTTFAYYPGTATHEWKLAYVKIPGNSTSEVDSLYYDTYGNLTETKNAIGARTDFMKDDIGRDTLVISDNNAAHRRKNRLEYDILDRVTEAQHIGLDTVIVVGTDSLFVPAETVFVGRFYDDVGRLDSLSRSPSPDPESIGTLTTRWAYDRAGRTVREVAPDGAVDSLVYDHAGSVTAHFPRHTSGDSIAHQYDELGRLTQKVTPSITYDSMNVGIPANASEFGGIAPSSIPPYPKFPNSGTSYVAVGDTTTYTYDAVGNLTSASNRYSEVKRSWNLDGTLATDTLRIGEVDDPTELGTHVYGTAYAYDASGRLERITHPASLAPGGGLYTTEYDYHAQTGLLTDITDPEGNQYSLAYDAAQRLETLTLPGGIVHEYAYYPDGGLARHDVLNNSTSPLAHPVDTLRADSLVYDLRGKLISSFGKQATHDTLRAWYSGLGFLVQQRFSSDGRNVLGNELKYGQLELFDYDALGNRRGWNSVDSVLVDGTGEGMSVFGGHVANSRGGHVYFGAGTDQGRLNRLEFENQGAQPNLSQYSYDPAGNTTFTHQEPTAVFDGDGRWEDRASFYDAEGRVVAADYGVVDNAGLPAQAPYRRIWEEYRYDPLGRRVLTLTNEDCGNDQLHFLPFCRQDYVVRTVWDGDREAWEIRMPDSVSVVENDTTTLSDLSHLEGSTRVDRNPLFGRVLYTYGGGVDQPLAVHRYGYADHPDGTSTFLDDWPVFTIVPVWNSRGRPDNGSFADGGQLFAHPSDSTRQVSIAWPAGFFAYWRRDDVDDLAMAGLAAGLANVSPFWHGSILRDKQDAVRTHYRRNRYYDPKTGQFTQEDPIGLAGGLNLYGFAAGDPVNFSDPFGLCPGCLGPLVANLTAQILNHRPASGRLESAGLFDPIAWVSGGVAGVVKGLFGRAASRGAAAALGRGVLGGTDDAVEAGARAVDPNKLQHIFGKAGRELDDVVASFGGREEAFNAIQRGAQELVESQGLSGVFEEVVRVGGMDVTVRGRVIDGVARIGTVFR